VAVAGNDTCVTVQLHEDVQLTLLRILLGDRSIRLTATAQAAPRPSGSP
jgi:hypothetical protein